jgi:hypothetical protein
MAGTVIGKVDMKFQSIPENLLVQEAFKNFFDFFEQMVAAGYATRIALQWGSTTSPVSGSSGLGTGYWDSAASFGENSFALYRMNGLASGNTQSARNGTTLPDFDYYVLFQWSVTSLFGASPGDPGLLNASTSDGLAVAIAVREDGGNPWNGTSVNDGTDSKGATVWTAGGSVLHVMPISNTYTAGSHTTNKENMRGVFDSGTITTRFHLVGNADSFMTVVDVSDDGSYVSSYFGVYSPRPGLNPSLPLACVSQNATLPWTDGTVTSWGSTAGNGANEGGVLGELLTDLMGPLSVGQLVAGVLEAEAQPNAQFSPAKFDSFPIRVIQRGTGRTGYVGDLDSGLIQVTYGTRSNSMSSDGAWGYFSTTTQNVIHLAVAWGGGAAPGSGSNRAGTTF